MPIANSLSARVASLCANVLTPLNSFLTAVSSSLQDHLHGLHPACMQQTVPPSQMDAEWLPGRCESRFLPPSSSNWNSTSRSDIMKFTPMAPFTHFVVAPNGVWMMASSLLPPLPFVTRHSRAAARTTRIFRNGYLILRYFSKSHHHLGQSISDIRKIFMMWDPPSRTAYQYYCLLLVQSPPQCKQGPSNSLIF